MDFNDSKTWDLFKQGRTKGVFQLESNLGKSWSKKLQPSNIEELSALIAIIRPGVLKSSIDGKSLANHYVDRKLGKDKTEYFHPALENILKSTYGVLVYQEESMLIAKQIAGFSLQEADELRKAIGKKKADLMAKIRVKFIDRAEALGIVKRSEAEQIFDWIEKSARYQFNKSHSVSYAVNAYMSAWYKANYTKEFFISSLSFAGDKQNPHREIYELVSEAKLFDIDIRVPDLTHFTEKFAWSNGKIYFGIKDIKSLTGVGGDKLLSQIKEASIAADKSPENLSWMDVLIYVSPKVSSTIFKTLASIGFFSTKSTNVSRNKALFEYAIFKQLSNGERDWVIQKYRERKWATLKDCLLALAPSKKRGGGTSKPDREIVILDEVKLIENPPYDLTDEPAWIIDQEIKFLGCPITLSKIDAVDTSASNISCKDIVNGRMGDDICLAANIVRYSPYKIKDGKNKGKTMAFLTLEDETCAIDNVVIFSEAREKYEMVLYEGNNLLFCGVVNKDGFVINKIHEI